MTTPLPQLLRRADEYLTGMTDPTGRTAVRDDARAELLDADGDVLAEYLEWDDALGAAKLPAILTELIDHPALAPALAEPPAREPATPPLSAVVLAKLICETANQGTPFIRSDGERNWRTNCIAVQRLAFLAHGYSLSWYGEPLVDEQFEMFNGGPSLASLRALPGWKFCAEEAQDVMAADTFTVARRHRAVVKSVVDGHGTWGKLIDERLAKWPVVIDGDFSQVAIHAHFLSLTARKEHTALSNRHRTADRADAIESMVDADTRTELLRRWLTAS